MKKGLLLMVCCLGFAVSKAQHCGNTALCNPTGLSKPGLTPSDSLLPFVNGENSTTVIQFKNFDTISFGGQTLTILWLRFDSIENLPDGLCWSTNKPDNKFNSGESGCIKISGTPCDSTGQYKLRMMVTPHFNFTPIFQPGDGIKYWLRLKNTGDADTPVDTVQTLVPFIPYGTTRVCAVGINDFSDVFNSFAIYPNPATNTVNISIDESIVGSALTITDITGRTIMVKPLPTANCVLPTDFPNGIYFVTLSNGAQSATRKLMIEK